MDANEVNLKTAIQTTEDTERTCRNQKDFLTTDDTDDTDKEKKGWGNHRKKRRVRSRLGFLFAGGGVGGSN